MPNVDELKSTQAAGVMPEADELVQAGETPKAEGDNLTPEQMKALLVENQKRIKELNKESADRRKKLEAYEKLESDKKNAEMTDLERVKAELAQVTGEIDKLRQEKQSLLLKSVFESTARTMKMAFSNEMAQEDAYRLLDQDTVGEDGKGMKEAMTALQKERPYLFAKFEAPETDARNKGKVNGDIVNTDVLAAKRAQYGSL